MPIDRLRYRGWIAGAAMAIAAVFIAAPTKAQDGSVVAAAGLYAPSVWDLELGGHAATLPSAEFIDFACGTRGGPPSLPLAGWLDFDRCAAEADTGLHEVYFQYDDEPEYWARALRLDTQVELYRYTSAYSIPVIVSALFDDDGFLMGFRMVTDPRVDLSRREKGSDLGGYLMARYDGAAWACADLPRLEGEREYQGDFFKRRCTQHDREEGFELVLEQHHLRKPGQFAVDPANGMPTEGQFESSTYFQLTLTREVPDREAVLANLPPRGQSEHDLLAIRARDCPGCDLAGAHLKRADLTGANLAGANLAGANLHGAILAGANLAGANLQGANLNRADLKRADLAGADLGEAMLYEARLDAAILTGARLQGAHASRVQLIRADLRDTNLSQIDLRDARLNDANFDGARINNAFLDDAQLSRSSMAAAQMVLTSFRFANMAGANLAGADVRASDLFGVNFRGANLANVDFSGSRLSNVNLSDAVTDGAVFADTLLPAGFVPGAP